MARKLSDTLLPYYSVKAENQRVKNFILPHTQVSSFWLVPGPGCVRIMRMLIPLGRVGGESGGCRKTPQEKTSVGTIMICFTMITVCCLGCRTTKSSEEDFLKPFD